jgi:hypothetical protein
MMLDGTLCQCCGVYIGDESLGEYPQYCPSCAKDAKKEEARLDTKVANLRRTTPKARN